jgi:hypothetical protein
LWAWWTWLTSADTEADRATAAENIDVERGDIVEVVEIFGRWWGESFMEQTAYYAI